MLGQVALVVVLVVAVSPARAATDDESPRLAPPPPPTRPAPQEASDAPPPPLSRHTAVYVVVGAGTPVGVAGFEGVRRAGSIFEISAGFGRGFAATAAQPNAAGIHSLQWAVMPRLRFGDERHVFTIGAGISGGYFGDFQLFCDEYCDRYDRPTSYVLWANFEVGGERWFNGGFALRYFVGYARGCAESSCTAAAAGGGELAFPYLGLGLGYAF